MQRSEDAKGPSCVRSKADRAPKRGARGRCLSRTNSQKNLDASGSAERNELLLKPGPEGSEAHPMTLNADRARRRTLRTASRMVLGCTAVAVVSGLLASSAHASAPRRISSTVLANSVMPVATLGASAHSDLRASLPRNEDTRMAGRMTPTPPKGQLANPTLASSGAPLPVTPAQSLAAVTSSPRSTSRPLLGVSVTTGFWSLPNLDLLGNALGRAPQIAMNYQGWSYSNPDLADFPTSQLDQVFDAGYLPEITWEPWDSSAGVVQPTYSLTSIIQGSHDAYIRSWASSAKAWGKPLLLRFAEEMNGTWRPWGAGVNGNQAGQYVQAWQHVYNIFSSIGATNVRWVWSPNIVDNASSAAELQSFYPGSEYVNVVGIDGYSYPAAGCASGQALFGRTLSYIDTFAKQMPIMIAETSLASTCPKRASLATTLFDWARSQRSIVGVTLFDHPGSPDYQIDTDNATISAIKSAWLG